MNSMSNFPNLQRLRITFLSEQEDLSKEDATCSILKRDLASGQSNLFQDTAEGLKKNHERSEWAAQAVLGFMNTTGCDASTAIRDLLGSMLHLSDRIGVDFKTELSAGSDFYAQETGDGTCD